MEHGKSPKVLLFLAQGFEDLEAVAVIDVLGWTEYREQIPKVTVTTTGFHDEVRGRFGLVIRPELHVSDVEGTEYAALVVPGGFHGYGFDEAYDPRLYDLAQRIHAQGGIIATMCVGVLPIAEAGLLLGKRATTYPYSRNHDNFGQLRALGCITMAGPVEMDDRIISCSGPAQAVEVALLLLGQVIGPEGASAVKRYLMWDGREPGGGP
jgi:4-methyl-5(b-hydroxyethyl)-thiazole monophosphate biosynthesis